MLKIDDLIALSVKAGEEILDVYARDFAVTYKQDESPVTDADMRAEAVILRELAGIAPEIPVVAEECVAAGIVPETGDRFFLVDPLDGSKEFISKNGEFTVNIALIEDGVPTLGVVYAPALCRIWWGAAGEGAWVGKIVEGRVTDVLQAKPRKLEAGGLKVVGSRSHNTPECDAYLATMQIAEFVPVGSSLKFCVVAEGGADLYPRFGRTMEWDTAAGDAILRAAGGIVETVDGTPLLYGKRNQASDSDFANPYFIARAC